MGEPLVEPLREGLCEPLGDRDIETLGVFVLDGRDEREADVQGVLRDETLVDLDAEGDSVRLIVGVDEEKGEDERMGEGEGSDVSVVVADVEHVDVALDEGEEMVVGPGGSVEDAESVRVAVPERDGRREAVGTPEDDELAVGTVEMVERALAEGHADDERDVAALLLDTAETLGTPEAVFVCVAVGVTVCETIGVRDGLL